MGQGCQGGRRDAQLTNTIRSAGGGKPMVAARRANMKGLNALRMVAAVLAALAAMPAIGQTYPTRPVKIVLPFGAGGVADVSSRIIADKLGERLGQRFL